MLAYCRSWFSPTRGGLRRSLLWLGLLVLVVAPFVPAGFYLWYEYHFRAAERAQAEQDLPAAWAHASLCVRWQPRSALSHFLAARCARRLALFDEAEQHLNECRRLQGGMSEPLRLEWSMLRAQRGEIDEMARALQPHITKGGPEALLMLEALSQGCLYTYRLPKALSYLQTWLERQPDSIRGLRYRGWVMQRLRHFTEAAADFRRVIDLRPEDDQARLDLAEILFRIHDVAEAVGHYEHLHQRQPENLQVLLGLARCRTELGQAEETRRLLDRLLAEHPDYAPALTERSKLALNGGDAEQASAESWLRRVLTLEPTSIEAHYLLALSLSRAGKVDEADQHFAAMKQLQGEADRFEQIMNQEMDRRPHDPGLCCELGRMLLRHREDALGVQWLHRALSFAPDYREAHAALADYYERSGDPSQAQQHRRFARP